MKTRILALMAFNPFLGLPAMIRADNAPAPRVDVTYVSPENFTDFKDSSMSTEKGRAYLEEEFTRHIRKVADYCLPAGSHLRLAFTDINLAGEYEPQLGPQYDEIRIMRQIYPPRMVLKFRLRGADGSVLAEGTRHLADMNYLTNVMLSHDDPLRYDKQLLTDWLQTEFRKKS